MKEKKRKHKGSDHDQMESIDGAPKNDFDDNQEKCDADDVECSAQDEINEPDDRDKQIEELTDKWRRTLAEFDNFRKRTMKEKAVMYDDGVRDAILKLLPVIDNFGRALSSETNKESNFYKGIDMIAKQLESYLRDMCVEEIPGNGETFDPNIHHAVAHVEDESRGENEVVEVLQKGYKHKDRVIRPVMVKVAN